MKDPNETLRQASDALKKLVEEKNKAKLEAERQTILDGVAKELPSLVKPLLNEVAQSARLNTDEVISAIKSVKIDPPPVTVTTPEAKVTVSHEMPPIPEISTAGIEAAIEKGIANAKFPEPKVTVNAPKIPEFPKIPDFPTIPEFPSEVSIKGVDKKSPFPVIMMGLDGKPMPFSTGGGSGGGRADFFTIKDIQASSGVSIIDNDGFLKVTGSFTASSSNASTQAIDSSGNVYNVANPFPVQVVSGGTATSAVNLVDSSGVAYSGSNPVPTSATLSVPQGQGDAATAMRVVVAGNSDVSVSATQVGTWNINTVTAVTGITNSVASALIDSAGNAYSGSNPFPVTFTGSSSTNMSLVNSDGSYYNSDNPLPVTFSAASVQPVSQVSGAAWSISVNDVFGSTGSNVINPDGRIKVELPTGASGLTDTELRASSVPVAQASGAAWSTFLTGASATLGVVTINPDGTPVYGGTSSGGTVQVQDSYGSSITSFGSGDSKGLAVAIVDASGNQITSFGGGTQYADAATASTPTGTVALGDTGDESGNIFSLSTFSGVVSSGTLRVVHAADVGVSVTATQTGTWNIGTVTTVTGITNSVASAIIDSSGVQYSTSNPFPISDAGGSLTVDGTVAVSGVSGTLGSNIVDSSGVAYSGSNPVPTSATQSGTWNIGTVTTVTGVTNSLAVVALDRDGNPLTTGPVDNGDSATALRVVVAGNSAASVVVNSGTITTVTAVTSITNSVASAIVDSSGVQYSTSNPVPIGDAGGSLTIDGTVTVSSVTASIAANIVDSSGVAFSGSNPVPTSATQSGTWNIGTVTAVTGITNSVASALVDSSGVQYSATNPVSIKVSDGTDTANVRPVGSGALDVSIVDGSGNQITSFGGGTQYTDGSTASIPTGTVSMGDTGEESGNIFSLSTFSGVVSSGTLRVVHASDAVASVNLATALSSTIDSITAVGDIAHDGVDSGNPLKIGGKATTTNPTAVASGDRVNAMFDDVGRIVTRSVHVRDLISTARVAITNGTETTLLAAGGTGVFLDCISIMAANNSTSAVKADFRSVTGGNVEFTLNVPASGTNGIVHAVPWPQGNSNNNWTVDMSDDTHDIVFTAMFSKEI